MNPQQPSQLKANDTCVDEAISSAPVLPTASGARAVLPRKRVLALLVLVEVEEVNVNLVLAVLIEIDVCTVDEVELLVLDAVLPEGLVLSLRGDALEDVDDVAANRVVDVGVDIEVELLDVVENRVVDVAALLRTGLTKMCLAHSNEDVGKARVLEHKALV
eukprot:4404087-Amphidinium_carterae.1